MEVLKRYAEGKGKEKKIPIASLKDNSKQYQKEFYFSMAFMSSLCILSVVVAIVNELRDCLFHHYVS